MSQNNPNKMYFSINKKETNSSSSEKCYDLSSATISTCNRLKKKFTVINTCDLCNNQIYFGLKCKKCKYRQQNDLINFDVANSDINANNNNSTISIINHNVIIQNLSTDNSDKTPSKPNTSGDNSSEDFVTDPDDDYFNSDSDDNDLNNIKQWQIPFKDIKLIEQIGIGRFGTVHRANWHGPVAIKTFNDNNNYRDDELFELEITTFKKTRHENIILFLGVCNQPKAIVTSLCKGNTLYTHLHLRNDIFNLNDAKQIGQQIAQGMGYLHSRQIIHKDLKTKNIFLENGKIIITDFGLLSVTKFEYRDGVGINLATNWLTYLSPEIIQNLKPYPVTIYEQLPFSYETDTYAFGTIWYELLTGEFPFKLQSPEAIIFQIGRGMKQSLANLYAPVEVKMILMQCWAYDYSLRPTFSTILELLKKLPKKPLERSPSNPVQFLRSIEFKY